jgi:hypothetical protein
MDESILFGPNRSFSCLVLHTIWDGVMQRKQELEESTASDDTAADAGSDELNDVLEQLEHIGAATAHTRASAMLRGLQFSSEQMAGPVASLSGGWRMRVALAQALFQVMPVSDHLPWLCVRAAMIPWSRFRHCRIVSPLL